MAERLATFALEPVRARRRDGTRAVYSLISALAVATSLAIWLLMIVDEDRGVGAATVQMAVKFTNLTVLLVGMVAAWIASGRWCGAVRAVAHITMLHMALVTAVVNATLLDAAVPGGWWGVVDVSQHYVIPIAVVAAWASIGPRIDVAGSRLGWSLVVPLVWLVFVLTRGQVVDSYPYDFIDVGESGWPRVLVAVGAIMVAMLAIGAAVRAIDGGRAH